MAISGYLYSCADRSSGYVVKAGARLHAGFTKVEPPLDFSNATLVLLHTYGIIDISHSVVHHR